MQLSIFLALFFFLICNGFVFLEEEVLVILLGLCWVYCFADLIYNMLVDELEGRGDQIKQRFVWYMSCKEVLLKDMISLHKERFSMYSSVLGLVNLFYFKAVESFLNSYLIQVRLFDCYTRVLELQQGVAMLSSVYVFDVYRIPFGRVTLD